MSGLSKQQLRQLVQARKRPVSEKIGDLPEVTRTALLEFWEQNRDRNVLADMIDARSQKGLPLENKAYLTKEYSQVLLQAPRERSEPTVSESFVEAVDPELVSQIQDIAGPFCKARLSCLLPGGEIGEHIDDPEQIRVISVIDGEHEFWVKAHENYRLISMQKGELWFVNTAWPHKVFNRSEKKRVALLINLLQPSREVVGT